MTIENEALRYTHEFRQLHWVTLTSQQGEFIEMMIQRSCMQQQEDDENEVRCTVS